MIDAVATIRALYYVHWISPAAPGHYKVVEHDAPDLDDELRKFYIYLIVLAGTARAHVNVMSNLLLTLDQRRVDTAT